MNRKGPWIVLGALLLALLVFGLTQVVAQRNFRTGASASPGAPFARYQVVTVNEKEVIIMDVTTGDLYSAKPSDVKPYSTRPGPARFGSGFATEKDKGYEKEDKKGYYKDDKKSEDKKYYEKKS
jgi:hypothetical protein